ncbi:hypothetical protein EJ08DRAFT_702540 [Tothia fuscella]|uniref:Mediator of RNA polymerase II transcription subunit 20 n=1 Tax=Tothia fuscella TaxID=1048955 RepID=A0A9P4NGK4_9PEZI|nr:hypothetical protein EJ08DRAFT_702540 [Tothia fuscella]
MTTTGIFHITSASNTASGSSNPLQVLKDRIITRTNPIPIASWQLDHRLLQEKSLTDGGKPPQRFQHLLRLSHHPSQLFVAVSPPGPEGEKEDAKNAVIALPVQQYNPFLGLLTSKFAAIWGPQAYLQVVDGMAYGAGEFQIRVGELRQNGSSTPDRGIICCIEATHAIDDEEDSLTPEEIQDLEGNAKAEIQALWTRIGFEGAKEVFTSGSPDGDAFDEARTWCDLLKLR